MRVKIEFKKTNKSLPINNQHIVNSYVHKLLGNNNEYHDKRSNYCVSQLCGGNMNEDKQTISFKDKSFIIITSSDVNFINSILNGLSNRFELYDGFVFNDSTFIEETLYNGWNHFFTLSPILITENNGFKRGKFITINDVDFESKFKYYLVNKLKKIDSTLNLKNFEIKIGDKTRKVKKILIKNVINHASAFQLSIKTNKKVASILYNEGVGMSTGSGFGTIYKTENYNFYKF